MSKLHFFPSRLVWLAAFLVLMIGCQSAEPVVEEREVTREVEVTVETEVEVTRNVEVEVTRIVEGQAGSPDTAADIEARGTSRTAEQKMENAMSAAPAQIANEAAILDYPEEWPGEWPDKVAPALPELRAGSNGWTCLVDRPDTPGNDPMCLNDTYLAVLMSQYNLVDAPSTGIGFGYMLQGSGPVGSPPYVMVFASESNSSVSTHGTNPGPFPWIMLPETSQQHLMFLAAPPANAMANANVAFEGNWLDRSATGPQ